MDIYLLNINKLKLKTSLSEDIINILLGSLLGDMSININKGYKNPRIQMRHSVSQQEYFLWKYNKLVSEIGGSYLIQKPDGYSKLNKLKYVSASKEDLVPIYELTHRKQKNITRKWLNTLNLLSLSIWWCDDGSIVRKGKQCILCTDSYNEKEVDIIIDYFKTVLNLKCKKFKLKTGHIRISITPVKDFLEMIIPYIPCKSMIYKYLIFYKDSILTQHWISYIEKNTNFSYDEILSIYNDRYKKKI